MTYPITSENEFNQLKLEFLRLQLNQKREKFQNIQQKIESTEDLKANEKSQLDKIMKLNLIAENRFELRSFEQKCLRTLFETRFPILTLERIGSFY